jgi:type III pantothenate kinase
MLFVMNIGNTNTQTAVWDGTCLSELRTCPTASLEVSMIRSAMPAAAASVVPEARRKLSECGIFWLGAEMRTGLDTSAMDMSTVGADRLANAVYLAERAQGRPAVCLDFGTAVTLEMVDGKKRFLGGAIAPGRMLLRRSLNQYTAQLPLIPMYDEPPSGTGLNTLDAIRMGVDGGAVGIARELLARAGAVFGGETPMAFGIGGDAGFFCRVIRELIYGGDDFTLRGVAKSWELNHL